MRSRSRTVLTALLTVLALFFTMVPAMAPAIAETEDDPGDPLTIRIDEPVDLTDEDSITSPPTISITETVVVTDQPNPPPTISITENITVTDQPNPPPTISITENITVTDQPNPPPTISITENITVTDQPNPPPTISITENITVTDQPNPPPTISITENITVTDQPNPPPTISITENITVTDQPNPPPTISITETVVVSDSVVTGTGPTGSIAGLVFYDPNRNGVQDGNEVVAPDVVIYLDLDDDGVRDGGEPSTATDASGRYVFPGLSAGEWVVRLIPPFFFEQIFPDPAVDRAHRISLQPGQEVTTAFFAIDVNPPPTIAPIPDKFAIVGQQLVINPITHDINNDPLTVLWDGFPLEWLTNGTLAINGVFAFTPSQPGMWEITATVIEVNNPTNFRSTTFRLTATGATSVPAGQPGISNPFVAPGTPLTVNGGGFMPGSTVGIHLFSDPILLATATADGDGKFETEVTVPAGTDPGEHQIIVSGVDPEGDLYTLAGLLVVEGTSGPVECPAGSNTWTGGGDGTSWSQAANWSTGAIPAAGQHVCINADAPLTLQPAAAVTIASLTTNGNASITTTAAFTVNSATQESVIGGNLSITGTGSAAFTSAAQIGGNLTLNAAGNATFTGGVDVIGPVIVTGAGDLVVDQPSTAGSLTLDGTTATQVRRSNPASAGSLVVTGPMTWGGGAFVNAIPVAAQGPSTWVTGAKQITSNAILTLNGDTDWQNGSLQFSGSGQLVNNQTLNINHNGSTTGGTAGLIVNNGTISVNASGTTTLNTTLTSNGTIVFTNDGTLILSGTGSVINGTVDVGEGGDLQMAGNVSWGPASSLHGTGHTTITSGTVTIGGSLNFGGWIFIEHGNLVVFGQSVVRYLSNGTDSRGNATFHNGVTFTDGVGIFSTYNQGGHLFLDGPSVAGSVTLNGTAGTLVGRSSPGTSGSLTVTGQLTWGWGVFYNGLPVTVEGTSTWVDGDKWMDQGGMLTLNGDTIWTGGLFRFVGIGNGSLVNNGTFNIEHDAIVEPGSARFTNNGTIHVNGPGTTEIRVDFDNNGTITWGNPTAGLNLAHGGTTTTEVHIPEGNTLQLQRRHNWEGGSSNLTGSGNLVFGKFGEISNVTFHDLFDFNGHITTFAPDAISELVINAPASISSLTNQGSVRFMKGVEVSGLLSVSDGFVALHGPSTAGALQVSGGLLGLRGETEADTLEVLGPFDWSGGVINGSFALPGTLAMTVHGESRLSGEAKTMSDLHMSLYDDTDWTAGGLFLTGSSGRLTSNAVFTINHDASMAGLGGAFENNGPLHVNGSGTTTIQPAFSNISTISTITWGTDTATLALTGGGTTTTSIDVPSGNTLRLGGAHNWTGGSSNLTGDGRLEVVPHAGTGFQPATFHDSFDFSGDVTTSRPLHVHDRASISSLTVLAQGISTVQTIFHQGVDVSGDTVISGNNQARLDLRGPSTTGTLTIENAAVLTKGLVTAEGPLEVLGSFDWSGGLIVSGVNTIVHGATTLSGGQKTVGVTLTLNGTSHWLTGQMSITAAGPGHLVNNGVFHVDHNATLQGSNLTNNGTLHVDNDLTVSGNTGGTFTNDGLVTVGSGRTLGMGTNNFVQTADGTLRFGVTESGGVSQNGRLTGSVTANTTVLAGTLEIEPSPGFTPTTGFTYPLIAKNGIVANAFTTLADTASGNTVSAPPNFVNGLTHTWEVLYNQSGSNVILRVGDLIGDTTPPVVTITTPGDTAVYEAGSMVLADYTCTDEGSGIDSCVGTVAHGDPINTGSVGPHQFTVTATDVAGNEAVVTHNYTVEEAPDTTPPIVILITPADGGVYEFGSTVQASYICIDPEPGIACIGPVASGAPIDTASLGPKTFTVTATDSAGNQTEVTHTYTIVDTTGPVFGPTPDITAEATGPGGANVSFMITATDLVDGPVIPVCEPPSGSPFAFGSTPVNCTATDAASNVSQASFTVTIVDTTGPLVSVLSPTQDAFLPLDQVINAIYECADLVGVATCEGTVPTGTPLDTSSLGAKTFTVTATDTTGNTTVVTHNYTVVPPPDTTPPVVTIITPGVGAEYEYGSTVLADYSCTDEAMLLSCIGSMIGVGLVANGDPLDTGSLGSKALRVMARDFGNNTTIVLHTYEVVDTTAPAVTPPDDITVEATGPLTPATHPGIAAFLAGATATDLVEGDVTDSITHDAPDSFPVGATVVTFTASDTTGNTGTATATITITDTTAPGVAITTPAEGAVFTLGHIVDADYACTDLVGIQSCMGTVANGIAIDTSSLGSHDFTVTATDTTGLVTVVTHSYTVQAAADVTPPVVVITIPADEGSYEYGSTVLAEYFCTDEGGSGMASCVGTVANGSPINTSSLGSHSFTVTGVDVAGNQTVVAHTYTVVDTTAPVVTPPADINVEATGPLTPATHPDIAAFLADATAIDLVDGDVTASITHNAPDNFPVGNTVVTFTATDQTGNQGSATANVTVEDTTPPEFGPTPNLTVEATGPAGAVVNYTVTATDLVDGDVSTACEPASGSVFDLGPTTVNCTATDQAGNTSNASFTVTVLDTTGPIVTITTPADGAEFTLGQVVNADYACTDLVGIQSCVGTVANGAPIDTSSLGGHSFTVTGADLAGNQTIVTNNYTVVPAAGTDATVTVDFPGLSGIRVELRRDNGVPGTATGTRIGLATDQIDQTIFTNIPFGYYDVIVRQAGMIVILDAVPVFADTTIGDLVTDMSVDLGALANIRLEVRTSDGSTETYGAGVVTLTGQSGEVDIPLLKGTYELVARQSGARLTVDPIDCTSTETCNPGDLLTNLTVDLGALANIRLEVRTSDGSTETIGAGVLTLTGQSGIVNIPLLKGTYELVAKQSNGLIVIDPIDCTSGSCNAGDLLTNLTVDLGALANIRLEVRTSDATPALGLGVVTLTGQSGIVNIPLLKGTYELVAKQSNSVIVVDPIDCSGTTCSPGDLLTTMTVDLGDLTNMRLEVRTSDGSTEILGAGVVTLTGQSGIVNIPLLKGTYELVVKQSNSTLVIDPIDCASSTCSPGDLLTTMTVDLGDLTNMRLEVRTSDGTSTQGLSVVTLTGQSGIVNIPLLKGSYELVVKQSNSTLVIDPIDCTSGTCGPGDLLTTMTVDLGALTNVRLEARTSDGTPALGLGVVTLTGQSGIVNLPLLRGAYELVVKQAGSTLVVDPIDCSGTTCSPGDLLTSMTVDLGSLTNMRLEVRTSDASIETIGASVVTLTGQSGIVNMPLLKGSYELVAKQSNGVIVIDPIDCSGTTCSPGDLLTSMTVDLGTLTNVRLEVRTSDGTTELGLGVVTLTGQSGTVTIPLLKGTYELVVKQSGSTLVIDPIDCTSEACNPGDLLTTMTVDLEGLTNMRLEVRTSDGSTGTLGTGVVTLTGQSGIVSIPLLKGTYELVAKQSNSTHVIDPIDCTSGACNPGDFLTTMTVDLGSLTNMRLEVRTSDGTSTQGLGVVTLTGQAGVVSIPLLKGMYELVAKQSNGVLVVDPIDCTSEACNAGDLLTTMTVDLGALTNIRLEVRTSDSSTEVLGAGVLTLTGQSGTVTIPLLKGTYELVAKQSNSTHVIDPIDCTSEACNADDLLTTMTVDLEGLTNMRLEVRTSDGSPGTLGTGVVTLTGQSGTVSIPLLKGTYELVVKQATATIVVDPITCTGTSCDPGSLANTITVDLGSRVNARVDIHLDDGISSSATGARILRLTGQSGIVDIPVLKGIYDILVVASGTTVIADGIDAGGDPIHVIV